MRRLAVAALLLAASVLLTAADPPRLVVVIVVDQMRADYIERFAGDWSSGLKRLVDRGAWFTEAAYPYLTTVTCAGHATIATGAYPHTHGIFQNSWFDRTRAQLVTCTDDREVAGVPYVRERGGRHSAGALRVPTLAEEMRRAGSRVVTLALKARSAIMLAGHGGDAVTWMSESQHGWETSSAFTAALVPQVAAFVSANPIEADYGKTWSRLLAPDVYKDADAGQGEVPPKGWTSTFPHVLSGDADDTRPDEEYYLQWDRSPFADEYVGRMAQALVTSMELGKGPRPDFLGVSFSSPDMVGHKFGPRSQEIQDMYARLDRVVGNLLDHLDRTVGAANYVVALSADHGVTDVPEQLQNTGRDAGRMSSRGTLDTVQRVATEELGAADYVARVNTNDIYFKPGMYGKLSTSPRALKAVVEAVAKRPGVQRVFTREELEHGADSEDPLLRAAALSYVPERGGDLVTAPKAGWMATSDATTHGSANPDDQHVPIVLFGAAFKSGRFAAAASPADIAPTLASLLGVSLTHAEGRVLREALR